MLHAVERQRTLIALDRGNVERIAAKHASCPISLQGLVACHADLSALKVELEVGPGRQLPSARTESLV